MSAVDAEAKLMLAGVVTVPSNGFVFHMCHRRPVMQDHVDHARP